MDYCAYIAHNYIYHIYYPYKQASVLNKSFFWVNPVVTNEIFTITILKHSHETKFLQSYNIYATAYTEVLQYAINMKSSMLTFAK